ncbi:MAG: hypothetical protein U0075_00375 [Thermomicrobiales bacterium]
MAPKPPRSPVYLAALSTLREADIPCTEHDLSEAILTALQPLIVVPATADPWAFDRARYDHLMGLWKDLAAEHD